MASIREIAPQNLDAFIDLIPEILQKNSLQAPYHFYGIEESGEASGVIVFEEDGDIAEIKYLYILPYLRGTGVMDQVLVSFFSQLSEEGYSSVSMRYVKDEYPVLDAIADRFSFVKRDLDYAYFKFKGEEIEKCKAASFSPKGIMRIRFLPEQKKQQLVKLINRNLKMYDRKITYNPEFMPYSLAYIEGGEPKGALVVESPRPVTLAAFEEVTKYPEPGAFDISLFFVGTNKEMVPLLLLSGLCRVIEKEMPSNVTITGYFPEGYIVKFLEAALGVKGHHEVQALLDIGGI